MNVFVQIPPLLLSAPLPIEYSLPNLAKIANVIWRARPSASNLHSTNHHQNSPCSTAPCTMFWTFLQVEWWLHGQLIVYIFDLCCRYFGRNKLLWS